MNPIAFFIQDPINGEFSIYSDGGKIVPATPEEIVGLESASVWDPGHVEDRLRDYFLGVPNKWEVSLKPKLNS